MSSDAVTGRPPHRPVQVGSAPGVADLAALTGVRSGKRSYYRAFRRSDERMKLAVRALDAISGVVVRPEAGPRLLLDEVVRAAAWHLQADWMLLAITDDQLAGTGARMLIVDPSGAVGDGTDARTPARLLAELAALRSGTSTVPSVGTEGWVRVPITLDEVVVGGLVGHHNLLEGVEPADLWVLRIMANQAAVSLHSSTLFETGVDLRRRAQDLFEQNEQRSRDLEKRTSELQQAEQRLAILHQRELIDAERHRIARELHDSVAQYVLSAGLAVDVCRTDAEASGHATRPYLDQMLHARDLISRAGDQLRSVIFALHHEPAAGDAISLPELLQQLADQHRPQLAVSVRIEGRPIALGSSTEHSLARAAGEALFNVSMHAKATKSIVRLRYNADVVSLWISDDGDGDPTHIRRILRLEARGQSDGRHRGLANMARRAQELGGTFTVRRSKMGGIRIDIRIPVSAGTEPEGNP